MPLNLAEWETFYVITGSSGAALTGLMFVVIALAAERVPISTASGPTLEFSAFATPTLIHFGAVLLVASLMSIPHQTRLSVGITLAISGVLGMIYSTVSIRRMRRSVRYEPVAEDWLWYAVLPFIAYVALIVASGLLLVTVEFALDIVGGVVILLLFTGIHNAWDVALYTATYNAAAAAPTANPAATSEAAPVQEEMASRVTGN
jgi:hypothetical protein